MELMYYSLWFIVGFLVGGSVVYFLAFKLSSKVKLQDELTRSKRELANAKRALDEYFSNSADLFAQLDRSYRQYARYMSHSANKLSELGQELFEVNSAQSFARHGGAAVTAAEGTEADPDADAPRLTRKSDAAVPQGGQGGLLTDATPAARPEDEARPEAGPADQDHQEAAARDDPPPQDRENAPSPDDRAAEPPPAAAGPELKI